MKTFPWHRLFIWLAVGGVIAAQLMPLDSTQYFVTVWVSLGCLVTGLFVKTMK